MKSIDGLLEEYDNRPLPGDCPACAGPCEFPDYHDDDEREKAINTERAWLAAWLRGIQDDVIASASSACAAVPEHNHGIDAQSRTLRYECAGMRAACCRAVCALHDRTPPPAPAIEVHEVREP